MMRAALLIVTALVCVAFLPGASAHDPPPEVGGIVFSLSGSGSSLELVRDTPEAAMQGSRTVMSGSTDIGIWTSEPLTAPLSIEGAVAQVVIYAHPGTGVIGQGMHISVSVMVDGEEQQSGISETIILNEPLWTNIPWISGEFDLLAETGQVIEVNIVAIVEGLGAARIQWGEPNDTPSSFSLKNWYLTRDESLDGSQLMATFDTPWNCTDIDSVTLETRGPVDDHDILWSNGPTPESQVVAREGCMVSADLSALDGTYLHRWQVIMKEGSISNHTGYFETDSGEEIATTAPLTLNLFGAIIGVALITIPLSIEVLALPLTMASVRGFRFETLREEKGTRLLALGSIVLVGLAAGLLTSPVIALAGCLGLVGLGWAVQDL